MSQWIWDLTCLFWWVLASVEFWSGFFFHEEDLLIRLISWYIRLQSLGLLINMVEHCGVNKRKLVEAETCRSYEVIADNATTRVPATKALCEVWPVLCILYKMMYFAYIYDWNVQEIVSLSLKRQSQKCSIHQSTANWFIYILWILDI